MYSSYGQYEEYEQAEPAEYYNTDVGTKETLQTRVANSPHRCTATSVSHCHPPPNTIVFCDAFRLHLKGAPQREGHIHILYE
jgi:hypothetical protein